MHPRWLIASLAVVALCQGAPVHGQTAASEKVLTGKAAFGDWRSDEPGRRRLIAPHDLPAPYATRSASSFSQEVKRPRDAQPKAPPGFAIRPFASGLEQPRTLRTAPNGDIFVAESSAGRVRVLRPAADGDSAARTRCLPRVCARRSASRSIRRARSPMGLRGEHQLGRALSLCGRRHEGARRTRDHRAKLPAGGGHWTRDLAFSLDGTRMFVSVGSASNAAEGMRPLDPAAMQRFEAEHGSAPLGQRDRAGRRAGVRPAGRQDGRSSPPASATASASRCSPAPATCGARPTSATGSATISRRIT